MPITGWSSEEFWSKILLEVRKEDPRLRAVLEDVSLKEFGEQIILEVPPGYCWHKTLVDKKSEQLLHLANKVAGSNASCPTCGSKENPIKNLICYEQEE